MATQGIALSIPQLDTDIDQIEVREFATDLPVAFTVEPYIPSPQNVDICGTTHCVWIGTQENMIDIPVHSRYRTSIEGIVSPMSDWSNAKPVPEPGLWLGHLACIIMLVFFCKWRGKQ